MKRIVYLLYCLSGLIALGYQTVWFRVLVDRFGSTNLIFVLVVVNFIGGLGAGSLVSRPLSNFIQKRLRLKGPFQTYGAIELMIALAAMMTPLSGMIPADLWGHFPYRLIHNPLLDNGFYQPVLSYQFCQMAISTALVFIPCFFMGLTFPLLCHAFENDARFPSALYGWNTLGSCAAVLACQLVFLPWLGHERTFFVVLGLNVVLGGVFLVLGGFVGKFDYVYEHEHEHEHEGITIGNGIHPSVLIACAVLSGLLCGALEGDMYKRVSFTGFRHTAAMSFISFWAIVAIFAGSVTARLSKSLDLMKIKAAFLWSLLVYILISRFAYTILDWLVALQMNEVMVQLVYIGIFVFPAYYLIALLLPYACNQMQGNRRHIGLAYGLNTVAFCVGMMMFTWVATRVNAFYSFKLMIGTFVLIVMLLMAMKDARPLAKWQPTVGVAAFACLCLFTPRGFDVRYFKPDSPPTKYPIRAMKSNGAHTTFILEDEITGDRLFFDSHSMSGTGLMPQLYMRLMAHVPLMVQEAPQKALLICFGVGNTASAIATYDSIKQLDIVDLNDKVFETAPEFAAFNKQVYLDPRVRLIHDDGRNFLNVTDQKYDLVTSEPPPPMQAGVYRLYSREYYEKVREHLTPTGMMTQWLPIEQMPPKAVDLAVATFVQSFPYTYAYIGTSTNIILLGGTQPIDLRRMEQWNRFGAKTLEDLETRCGIQRPLQILTVFTHGTPTLQRLYGKAPVISDLRNDFENVVFTRLAGTMPYDPSTMLDELGMDRLAEGKEVRRICMNLALLRSVAPDFPVELLATTKTSGAVEHGVAFADADWNRITQLNIDATTAYQKGRLDEAVQLLDQSLALAGDQCLMMEGKASILERMGRDDEAQKVHAQIQKLRNP